MRPTVWPRATSPISGRRRTRRDFPPVRRHPLPRRHRPRAGTGRLRRQFLSMPQDLEVTGCAADPRPFRPCRAGPAGGPPGGEAADPAIPAYVEETASAGFAHSFTGEWEFMVGGGAAVFDCSGDGLARGLCRRRHCPRRPFPQRQRKGRPPVADPRRQRAGIDRRLGRYPLDIDGDGVLDLALCASGPTG